MNSSAVPADKPPEPERHCVELETFVGEFEVAIPDETSARLHYFHEATSKGVACYCGHVGKPDDELARHFRCEKCKKLVWVTAQTIFADVRKFRPWILVIRLMENGVKFTPHNLHELVGISVSTLNDIKRKIDSVVLSQMPEDAPTVPSGLFAALLSRRTTETPARSHPRSEQLEMELQQGVRVEQLEDDAVVSVVVQSPIDAFSGPLSDSELAIWNCLTSEFTHFDDLFNQAELEIGEFNAVLMYLELRGLVKRSYDRYARVKQPKTSAVDISQLPVSDFVAFVRSIHGGIGRRLLQFYLASYWCFVDSQRWGPGKIFAACLKSPPVSAGQLRSYVTPLMVKILPRCG